MITVTRTKRNAYLDENYNHIERLQRRITNHPPLEQIRCPCNKFSPFKSMKNTMMRLWILDLTKMNRNPNT